MELFELFMDVHFLPLSIQYQLGLYFFDLMQILGKEGKTQFDITHYLSTGYIIRKNIISTVTTDRRL